MASLNDGQINDALARAKQEQQMRQQMELVLRATLAQPQVSKTAHVNMTMVATDGNLVMLLVALPSGERWEISMSRQAAKTTGQQLIDAAAADADDA